MKIKTGSLSPLLALVGFKTKSFRQSSAPGDPSPRYSLCTPYGAGVKLQALDHSQNRIASRIHAYDVKTRYVLEKYRLNNKLLLACIIKLNMEGELSDFQSRDA